MKRLRLSRLLFLALCCDLGLFAKQLVAPVANSITDALHIPGGIGTGFSLMFLAIACALTPHFGCGTLMSLTQSLIALALGRIGSMGILSPIGYVVPGFAMDCAFWLLRRRHVRIEDAMVPANAVASACAALAANLIVFRLWGAPLLLYLSVAATSGALCGLLGARMLPLVARAIRAPRTDRD